MKMYKLLPYEKMEVLKVLEIVGPEWNLFSGYVMYSRKLSSTYNEKSDDILDQSILEAIRGTYEKTRVFRSVPILFEDVKDQIIQNHTGALEIDFSLRFMPVITMDEAMALVGKEFNAPVLQTKLKFMLPPDPQKLKYVYKDHLIYIPHEPLEELMNTVILPPNNN